MNGQPQRRHPRTTTRIKAQIDGTLNTIDVGRRCDD
jgi:hypothetical protein